MPSFFSNIRGDLFGGITAGIVALPLALAFGVQSGMGAVAGLYGAIVLGIVASIFGGTPAQVSGPTGPMTVVSALVVLQAIDLYGSVEEGLGFIILIFILAGLIQIFYGMAKIGGYIEYIPYPVVSGFMSGIGVIIILLQVFPFVGLTSPKKVLDVVLDLDIALSNINWEAVVLASATIAVIYLFPRITRAVPSTLVALISLTLVSTWVDFKVPIIDVIPTGIPQFKLDTLANVDVSAAMIIMELALTLSLLGAIDSLLTSVIADNVTKTKHNSNRELIGQGLGNMMAGCFGGLPGAGATMRTLVNIHSGGRTRLAGVIHGLLLLMILLGAGEYARLIPLPVLAGILITVGVGIIDYKSLRHMPHVPRADAVVLVLVFLMTVFIDLIQAVAAGMILSSILFMKQMSDQVGRELKVAPLKEFIQEFPWEDEHIPDEIADKIYVKHLDGPFFFGFASAFQKMAKKLPQVKVVIFQMKKVPHMDQTGLYAFEEVVLDLEKKDVAVVITGLQRQPLRMLRRINLVPGLIPEHYIFNQFEDCIKWLESVLKSSNGNQQQFFEELGKSIEAKVPPPKYRL